VLVKFKFNKTSRTGNFMGVIWTGLLRRSSTPKYTPRASIMCVMTERIIMILHRTHVVNAPVPRARAKRSSWPGGAATADNLCKFSGHVCTTIPGIAILIYIYYIARIHGIIRITTYISDQWICLVDRTKRAMGNLSAKAKETHVSSGVHIAIYV